jgi:hypothetical protein
MTTPTASARTARVPAKLANVTVRNSSQSKPVLHLV